ncbi:MAG: tail fiber domain-containing protein [bacterium]|nr:tail fiber domain-containing protein [bacterium]
MRHVAIHRILTLALVAIVAPIMAAASDQPNRIVPTVVVEPTQVLFSVSTGDGDLVLSVSGPEGVFYQRKFKAGTEPTFSVFGQREDTLPDGLYNYEIKLIPHLDPETINALKAARKSGDTEIISKLRAQEKLPRSGMIRSGSLLILNGAFVLPANEEPADASVNASGFDLKIMDVLHYDDVIVTGSLCVGFDCANGELFGYDTFKLKENNLRLYFEDTSAGSFPSGDWRIRINDTTSGGASYFAIEDGTNGRTPFRIETGAPTHSLYVEDYGRVGLGTSIPYVELHIVDGDTPTVRLDQDGSSGWTAQSWDIAGNETNFFVRDVTNGSKLVFRIRPNAPTDSIYIDSDGDIGFGTASPDYDLDIDNGTTAAANFVVRGQSGSMILQDQDSGGGAAQHLVNAGLWRLRGLNASLSSQTAVGMSLDLNDSDVGINCSSAADHDLVIANGGSCTSTPRSWIDAGSTSFSTSSSILLKENLTTIKIDDILKVVSQIAVHSYDFIGGPRNRVGLIAEDFHKIFGRGLEQELNGQEVQMALWLAVQELASENKRLVDQNQDFSERLNRLEAAMDTRLANEN